MDNKRILLTGYTIYDHPLDYPHDFVVRGWDVNKGGEILPHDSVTRHETLEQARRRIPEGLCRMARFEDDDPSVIEVWI